MSITFEAVADKDQAIRPPAGVVLPEGKLRVTVQAVKPNGVRSQRSPAEILAEIAKSSTGSGDPNTSRDHDTVLYGERRKS